MLTVSANGSTAGTGLVWSSMPISGDADHGVTPGVLRVFDANNLSTELWDSQINASQDAMGNWPKYSPPVVDNGKVYMASFPSDGVSSTNISVYGLYSNFSLTASPASYTVTAGGSATYTVTATAFSGFSGSVAFSVSGLPSGATASFSPASLTGSGTSTLTITTTGSTPAGTSTVTITGMSGTITRTTSVSLVVNAVPPAPDFTITASPSTQTVVIGNATTYTATIGALNGFGGVVTLSATGLPTGATASFSPATVTGSGPATLTVSTTASTPAGPSTLTITGTSGGLVHSTTVTLTVTLAGKGVVGIKFVGQGNPMGSTEVAGVVAKSNWNNASGMTNTTGQPLVDETGTTTGATVVWNTNGLWELPITDTPGNARMMRGYLDTVGSVTTVTVAGLPGNAAGYDVYVYADGDDPYSTRTSAYQISGPGITTTSVNLTDLLNVNFSGTFTQANNSAGNYVLFTVNANGFTITSTPGAAPDGFPRAPVNAIQIVPHVPTSPDFSIAATPSTQTVVAGSATTYTATIAVLNGFTGAVNLSVSGLPAGTTASFAPSTITGAGTSMLTVSTTGSTPVGTSTLTITGTSGTLTHTTPTSLVVNAQPPPPDFSISASPGAQTVAAGNPTTYTATIGSLNGFAGVVTLSAAGLPTGATTTFAPTTITGSGTSTLTVTTSSTTPAGTSTVTLTGMSGSTTHTTTLTLTVLAPGTPRVIGIKFVGQGTVMGSTEVAGVVQKSNWNNASGLTNPTSQALVDETGTTTGATLTWNTNGIWNLPITDTPGDMRMMRGYLDTVGGITTATVAGLATNAAGYDVYVYADGDNSGGTRTAAYQISGTGITTTSVNLTDPQGVNFSGTYSQANNSAGNYVKFTVNATGFTITATPGAATDNTPRAPLNAIQIVPHVATSPDFTISVSPSTRTVIQGGVATYTVTVGAINGFTGTVTLSASGLPTGATATFSPATVATSGSSTLTVTTIGSTPIGTSTLTISGVSGSTTHTSTPTLTISVGPPVINSATTANGTVGSAFSYQITATNSPTSYGATGLPAGLTVNTSTGQITGTPTGAGTSTVAMSAINGGGTGTATLTLTINPATPVITSATTASGTVGSAFSYQITATNSPTSYGATGLPSGVTVNTSTGAISGTPTATGTFTVSLSATNSGGTGTATLTLTINPAKPVITSATIASGTVGSAFSYQITATNSPTSYGATGLPSGVTVNTSTGAISGTPTASGTFTVSLSAANSGGTGTATLTLTISPGSIIVSSAQIAANAISNASSFSLSFPGNTAPGDLILVAFDYDTNTTPSSVTDTQGNVFTPIGNQLTSPGGTRSRVYYAKNIKGGADTVKVTLSGTSGWIELYITEYTGADQTNPIDAQSGATGAAGPVSSGSATTTTAGDAIFGYCVADWACTAGSGFTPRSNFNNNLIEDEKAGAAGSYAATGTATNGWTMQMVAIKP